MKNRICKWCYVEYIGKSTYCKQCSTDSGFISQSKWRGHVFYPGSACVTMPEIVTLRKKYGNACMVCGSTVSVAIDHIVPVAIGGTLTVENLQLLCRSCNGSKGDDVIYDCRPDKDSCQTPKMQAVEDAYCNCNEKSYFSFCPRDKMRRNQERYERRKVASLGRWMERLSSKQP